MPKALILPNLQALVLRSRYSWPRQDRHAAQTGTSQSDRDSNVVGFMRINVDRALAPERPGHMPKRLGL